MLFYLALLCLLSCCFAANCVDKIHNVITAHDCGGPDAFVKFEVAALFLVV